MLKKASDMNEVPIGAVIVRNNQVIGAGHNSTITKNSVTAHAELEAIDAAGTLLGNHRLIDCDMYVTVEAMSHVCKSNCSCKTQKVIYRLFRT